MINRIQEYPLSFGMPDSPCKNKDGDIDINHITFKQLGEPLIDICDQELKQQILMDMWLKSKNNDS